jgi:AbrB family looped-hinge helix DNA binding protein
MPCVVVSSKGWLVIPAEYRRKYHVLPGSRVEVVDFGGGLSVVPLLTDPIREAQGLLKSNRGLTGRLLADRAEERGREADR